MKVISIYNNKGGVGKTTTTKHFAKYLSKRGKNVLLIDLDPQCNLSSQFMISDDNVYENATKEKNITRLLLEECSLEDMTCNTKYENISIIYSHISMLETNEKMFFAAALKNPATLLKNKLVSSDTEYDYVLIDCPPTMDLLITNALTVSDEVVIPINADSYSIDGITMLLQRINEVKLGYNNNLKVSKIFMNCYENTNLHKALKESFANSLEDFSDSTIGKYTIVKKDTLVSDDTEIDQHKIQEQYNNLFDEICGDKND